MLLLLHVMHCGYLCCHAAAGLAQEGLQRPLHHWRQPLQLHLLRAPLTLIVV